jgi:hypothetical protein
MDAATSLVKSLFTEEIVTIGSYVHSDLLLLCDALKDERVRVRHLKLHCGVTVLSAQALRDGLRINRSLQALEVFQTYKGTVIEVLTGVSESSIEDLDLSYGRNYDEQDISLIVAA